jgi:ubiquinone/menaquinone biosynthesis C-methylase UbiE
MTTILKNFRRGWKYLSWRILGFRQQTCNTPGKVASQWSGLASEAFVHDLERISWTGIPQVHLNHNYLMTGSREMYWVDWMRERFFPDGEAGDVLSLGCGAGHLDRILKRHKFSFRSFTGIDISEEAIERARVLADEIGLAPTIRYSAADLNRIELPACSFDFIYFFQSLHHIEALEHILGQCQRALRPDGLLLINEFVGPSRFQWSSRQLEIANQITALLPEDLRRDLQSGGLKTEVARPSVQHMVRHDPSEAVRSGEIEGLVKARFAVVGEWNWGGTLNHLVFQNIAANFDSENVYHRSIIEFLIHHENVLIREGLLRSDFKVFLVRLMPLTTVPGSANENQKHSHLS